jgi:hypothetical protein
LSRPKPTRVVQPTEEEEEGEEEEEEVMFVKFVNQIGHGYLYLTMHH